MDTLTVPERSERMARIKSKNTKVELTIRRALHAAGHRYRLHYKGLPGRPDIVFPSQRAAVFVHGCFWHRHDGCALARLPKSRLDFWLPKLTRNKQRDDEVQRALKQAGWRSLVLWECELRDTTKALRRVERFLKRGGKNA